MGDVCASGAEYGFGHPGDGHPIALAKDIVDRALAPLSPVLVGLAAAQWNLAVRPEVVLRAVAFMALLDPAGDPLAGRLEHDRHVRWFVGLGTGERAVDSQALDEGQRRLITNLFARQFMRDVITAARASATSPRGRFCENARLILAWTSQAPDQAAALRAG
jgi:hypothetical protein